MPFARLSSEHARTRAAPSGFNIIIAEDPAEAEEDRAFFRSQIAAAGGAGAAAVVLFWGDAAPYVDEAYAVGVKIAIQVGSVDEARAAAEAGVDAVIAQGIEAGGHIRGTASVGSATRTARVSSRLGGSYP
jgi:NAD(P)H-dependent flavin oxidoreductase YrpB (nitropropane dioxygenase family)